MRQCSAQTALRVWDALLSEGAKVLFRVALALLRGAEPGLAAQDNAGDAARVAKAAAAAAYDRDALLKARTGRPPAYPNPISSEAEGGKEPGGTSAAARAAAGTWSRARSR